MEGSLPTLQNRVIFTYTSEGSDPFLHSRMEQLYHAPEWSDPYLHSRMEQLYHTPEGVSFTYTPEGVSLTYTPEWSGL